MGDAQRLIEQYELTRISQSKSYYEVLNCHKESSAAERKRAHNKLCRLLHPDKVKNSGEAIKLINKAFNTLNDPQEHSEYKFELGKHWVHQ